MKSKYIILTIIVILALTLAGYLYFNHSKIITTAETPDHQGAYAATHHLSQDQAIAALNADNIQAKAYFGNGDFRIYLKDKPQWFIIDGDGKKFQQALDSCGARCMSIPYVIP